MPIQIYNSLTRKKEPFEPINPPEVNIYTCGVTVYDACHLGHARSLYIFDLFRRYLAYRGYKVNFIRNITDIDDKIINRAKELKVDWRELVEKYIESYKNDLKELGIPEADSEPRATDNIPEMLKYIEGLIAEGYAYITDSGVYFSVRKFKNYGKLSGQDIAQMSSGARIEPDDTKQDKLDFALWKKAKTGEPSWDSSWGKGRPGWHIECSAMSVKFLKTDTLDIHAGGRDLIFPHHENEIAQSEALTGKQFAKYWLHHGLLTINSQKMAKSLGNFITIEDFLREEKPCILKLFFLSAHYQSHLDYNEKALHTAREHAETLDVLFERLKYRKQKDNIANTQEADEFKERFIQAMDDNFNTPVALSILLEMASCGNKHIDQNNIEKSLAISQTLTELLEILNLEEIPAISQEMLFTSEVVGILGSLQDEYKDEFRKYSIDLIILENRGDEIGNQKKLIENFENLRASARKNSDFSLSDKIRVDLHKKAGIILEDTGEGTRWRVKI